MDLPALLRFTSLIHQFLKIERKPFATGTDRAETDMEHSFQLALTAWYLNDRHKLGMSVEKLLKYALAHDLVEVYAGDTWAFTKDEAMRASKRTRELEAAQKLKAQHPEFPELHAVIEDYEARNGREAKFVYALDKILPMMNIYLDKGRSWRRDGVSLDMVLAYKEGKVSLSPEVQRYFEALVAKLREEEREVFGSGS